MMILHAPAREDTASTYLDCLWYEVPSGFVTAFGTRGPDRAYTAVSSITNGRMHLLVARVRIAEAVAVGLAFFACLKFNYRKRRTISR
jgi:hypothetical protein